MTISNAVARWTHSSGATVYLVERHDLPYVSFTLTLRSGALHDPDGLTGVTSLMAELMARGAGDRDREALAEAFEQLGTELDASASKTSISFDGDALARTIDDVFALAADVLLRPRFDPDTFAKLKRERRAELIQIRDDDAALNRRLFTRHLFGPQHPYGRPTYGTLASLQAARLDHLRAAYELHVRPSNLIVGFAGDLTRAQADALIDRHLTPQLTARPTDPLPPLQAVPPSAPPQGRGVLLIDKPDRTQHQILLGHLAPPSTHPDHDALEVVNTLFGGTFTARLNHVIRDQRGLSYGAYSNLRADPFAGSFSMTTEPSAADTLTALSLLLELFDQLRTQPLTPDDVRFARDYLTRSFAFRIDTPDKLLNAAIDAELLGLGGPAYLDAYTQRIHAVTADDANRVIQQWLDPANVLIAILCTASDLAPLLDTVDTLNLLQTIPYDTPL